MSTTRGVVGAVAVMAGLLLGLLLLVFPTLGVLGGIFTLAAISLSSRAKSLFGLFLLGAGVPWLILGGVHVIDPCRPENGCSGPDLRPLMLIGLGAVVSGTLIAANSNRDGF
jgi:hypothetical protein